MNIDLITRIDWTDSKVLKAIHETVAKGTTPAEFTMFTEQCKATGLNPFKKEIWCIVTGSNEYRKVQMMTGLMGYWQIANSHPQFDGVEYSYGATRKVQAGSAEIDVYDWVETRIYRKDRSKPISYRAYWDEWKGDLVSKNGKLMQWGIRGKYMLQKVSECHALKRSFPQELSGFCTEEEMPAEFSVVETEKVETPAPAEVVVPETEEGIKIRYRYDVAKWVLEDEANLNKLENLLGKIHQRFWANYDVKTGIVESEHELANLKRFEMTKDLNQGGAWPVVDMEEAL